MDVQIKARITKNGMSRTACEAYAKAVRSFFRSYEYGDCFKIDPILKYAEHGDSYICIGNGGSLQIDAHSLTVMFLQMSEDKRFAGCEIKVAVIDDFASCELITFLNGKRVTAA